MLDLDGLKAEFRLSNDGDSWGTAMQWRFAIAAVLYDRDEDIPGDWHYRPSPMAGPQADPECYADQVCSEADSGALLEFGIILDRYDSMLRAAGQDY